uniref:Secreted protein n=1 Tax=Ixodes ricinus TaxID=34613 RepID=A0A6B0UFL5_IXORI
MVKTSEGRRAWCRGTAGSLVRLLLLLGGRVLESLEEASGNAVRGPREQPLEEHHLVSLYEQLQHLLVAPAAHRGQRRARCDTHLDLVRETLGVDAVSLESLD